jgi:hypothetical protein
MSVAVFIWLLEHLACLDSPPPIRRRERPPLLLAQRLDAFWLVIGEGLCQPDGTFIRSLEDLSAVLSEMAEHREPVCIDGMGIRTQLPYSRPNQYQLWDHHHHQAGVRATVVCDVYDTLLWVDGGWPGNVAERAACELAGITEVLIDSKVPVLADRGYRVRDKASWPGLITPLGRWNQELQWSEQMNTVNYLQAGLRVGREGGGTPSSREGLSPLARAHRTDQGGVARRRGRDLPQPVALSGAGVMNLWTPSLVNPL